MAKLPERVPIPKKPLNINFSWTDIASGEGYAEFYASKATSNYVLQTQQILSSVIDQKSTTNTSGAWVKGLDLNFDSSAFNQTRTLSGTAYITASWFATRTAGAGLWQCELRIYIYKYDGSTETQVGYAVSDKAQGYGGVNARTGCIPIELTETKLNVGDVLRIAVEVWHGPWSTGDQGYCGIAHDPADRAGTYFTDPSTNTTQLKAYIPFKIQL